MNLIEIAQMLRAEGEAMGQTYGFTPYDGPRESGLNFSSEYGGLREQTTSSKDELLTTQEIDEIVCGEWR